MSDTTISRRSLLAAGACAAVAGVGLAATKAFAADDVTALNAADVAWTEEADVVVVGFGGAGAAAAIEATKAGARVVLLEMLDIAGGSTIANGGFIMMGGTKLQEKFGLEDDVENFYNYMAAAAGANACLDHIKVLCDASPALYDWCVECGMDFESGECDTEHHLGGYNAGFSLGYSGNEMARNFAAVANPVPRGHMPQPNSSGFDMFTALSNTVESLGVDVRMGTPAKRLVVDETGRVCGVIAEGPDGELAIQATKGVILTAGGFTNNPAMIDENFALLNRRGAGLVAAGNENGSGILMGQAVGAATRGMGCFQIGATISTLNDALPHCILVDENARRIVAEDEYNAFIGKALAMAPSGSCYLIIDDQYATEGGAADSYGEPLATCDTMDELAAATGLNAEVLASTVAFYNESAAQGLDREFGKDPKYLTPLEQGPFHVFAYGMDRCYVGSLGGLKIDTESHVIDLDGNVIPGLYAAGRNAGTIYGWYVGSGSSMADVLTFGCIAGRNAAAGK
ncbi:MAG: FAD-dependent oxidoreductase [Coriobacteriia bacterium]|nr:FAD-dependent oxidoreductase [Coriobacteriia bacterium]MBS5478220.1 FAD-dependent oxidoreductase [Coriobacteriia bacterium]